MPTPTYDAIATVVASGSTNQIDFTSIGSTYTSLVIKYYGKSNSGGTQGLYVRFNDDAANNYSDTEVTANPTTVPSGRDTNQSGYRSVVLDNTYTNWAEIEINNAKGGNMKAISSKTNLKFSFMKIAVGRWTGTAAITKVSIILPANLIAAGSTFSLYGLVSA
jgi:hypothetical protein